MESGIGMKNMIIFNIAWINSILYKASLLSVTILIFQNYFAALRENLIQINRIKFPVVIINQIDYKTKYGNPFQIVSKKRNLWIENVNNFFFDYWKTTDKG